MGARGVLQQPCVVVLIDCASDRVTPEDNHSVGVCVVNCRLGAPTWWKSTHRRDFQPPWCPTQTIFIEQKPCIIQALRKRAARVIASKDNQLVASGIIDGA